MEEDWRAADYRENHLPSSHAPGLKRRCGVYHPQTSHTHKLNCIRIQASVEMLGVLTFLFCQCWCTKNEYTSDTSHIQPRTWTYLRCDCWVCCISTVLLGKRVNFFFKLHTQFYSSVTHRKRENGTHPKTLSSLSSATVKRTHWWCRPICVTYAFDHVYITCVWSRLHTIASNQSVTYWIRGYSVRFHSKFKFRCAQVLWKISLYPPQPALFRATCSTLFRANKPILFRTNPPKDHGSMALLCWTSPLWHKPATESLQGCYQIQSRCLYCPSLWIKRGSYESCESKGKYK